MKCVKRNADRQQDVEVRRLIDDADAREQPLEILEQKVSVFKEAEHAQIHADARDQPAATLFLIFRFADLSAEPEIHRGGGKKQCGKRRIPRAIENVTRNDEKIFTCLPRSDAPIRRDYDHEENNERERIKEHSGSPAFLAKDLASACTFTRKAFAESLTAVCDFTGRRGIVNWLRGRCAFRQREGVVLRFTDTELQICVGIKLAHSYQARSPYTSTGNVSAREISSVIWKLEEDLSTDLADSRKKQASQESRNLGDRELANSLNACRNSLGI